MLACALCSRRLLPGELYRLFRGERSHEHVVCRLCEDEAHAQHWLLVERPPSRVPVHHLAQTVRPAA